MSKSNPPKMIWRVALLLEKVACGSSGIRIIKRRFSGNTHRGFTLIELMVVIAILGALALVALQAYTTYTVRSANSACLAEAKFYANLALAALHVRDFEVPDPRVVACQSIEKVTNLETPIVAIAKSPGTAQIICDMSTSATCEITE